MIASLPMYDWPEVRPQTDALWAAIRDALAARGLAAPDRLTRDREPWDVWRDPDLLLAQSCGYPYATRLRGVVRLVAVPVYTADGCAGATYRSAVLVRTGEPAATAADLRGRRVAFNSRDSQSGYNALRAAVAHLSVDGRFFAEAVETGAHRASIEAVAVGAADCAAIDAVAWALARRHMPDIAGKLRVIAWTAPAPALPFVTAASRSDGEVLAVREALREVLGAPALAEAREALLLAGVEVAGDGVYDQILDMERTAVESGYPELR